MSETISFELGQCRATHGAMGALEDNQLPPIVLLQRHAAGDWGILSADDWQRNQDALTDGERILSNYVLPDGQKLWVITDAKDDDGVRESTCILLPSEY